MDNDLLAAVNHGEFLINGFRNRDLQEPLYANPAESPAERRRRSSAISRKLRMLRAHGLIQKVSHTHRYHVTGAGRAILLAVLTTARTSVHQLNQMQQAA
jgi:glycine cleavage system aminomethyltransferase T